MFYQPWHNLSYGYRIAEIVLNLRTRTERNYSCIDVRYLKERDKIRLHRYYTHIAVLISITVTFVL